MISVILYGRNDNYGYNLHKRAALSFNCIAELLTAPHDEILFVDYNTPDDYPTFPEAVHDTLTKKARRLLRVFRVRPAVHERYKNKTRLAALEPIARNVALRRSSPMNRWVLSTNTDMIFVPQRRHNLNDLVRDLADGFYHAPRMEVPETLWESLNRSEPAVCIETIRNWGETLHLNEIVFGSDTILYDGPGDFQLILRSDLFKYDGFDERMLLGWHVDSNIAKRLSLIYGAVGDLGREVFGYHCDHTRQLTPAHVAGTRTENDWRLFVDGVDRADLPSQTNTWGCADTNVEEVSLNGSTAFDFISALAETIEIPLRIPKTVRYSWDTYNRVDYDLQHLMPFLGDLFISSPRHIDVAWAGRRKDTLAKFAELWKRLGFTGQIVLDQELAPTMEGIAGRVLYVSTDQLSVRANAFVFDFGQGQGFSETSLGDEDGRGLVRRMLVKAVRHEQEAIQKGQQPRRFIALNAIHNEFEAFVLEHVDAGLTPFSARIRHGFVRPRPTGRQEWLRFMAVGESGIREPATDLRHSDAIKSVPGRLGFLTYGPYRHLWAGDFKMAFQLADLVVDPKIPAVQPCIVVAILAGGQCLGLSVILRKDLDQRVSSCLFFVPPDIADAGLGIEIRIRLIIPLSLTLTAVSVEPVDIIPVREPLIATELRNWFWLLSIGPHAQYDEIGIMMEAGKFGYVVYGPYLPLPTGSYEMVIDVERLNGDRTVRDLGKADVVTKDQVLAARDLYFDLESIQRPQPESFRIGFHVPPNLADRHPIETRFLSVGKVGVRVRSLRVEQLKTQRVGRADATPPIIPEDWLTYLHLGQDAAADKSGVRMDAKKSGLVVHGPYWRLGAGDYELIVELAATTLCRSAYPLGLIYVVAEGGYREIGLGEIRVTFLESVKGEMTSFRIPFQVTANLAGIAGIETRVTSNGRAGLLIRSMKVLAARA